MKMGVIGVGRLGTRHARVLSEHPDVSAVVVSDVDTRRARQVASELGCAAEDDVAAVFSRVDAVVIAAASDAHAALLLRAAEARVPAFCEKPITIDLESTYAVADRLKEAGILVQMGFQRRFDPGYREARRLVESGAMGTLYVVRMASHDPAPPHESFIPTSGGLFRDFSLHDFDALRFVTGQEIAEVYADGGVLGFPMYEKYGDIDTGVAVVKLEGGAMGILSSTRHDPLGYDIRMELFGSRDSVAVGLDTRTPLRSPSVLMRTLMRIQASCPS